MSLENILRGIAKRGELSHVSIIPTAGKGNDGVVFSAHYRAASAKYGEGFARDADPVKALLDAITASKLPAKKLEASEVDELLS